MNSHATKHLSTSKTTQYTFSFAVSFWDFLQCVRVKMSSFGALKIFISPNVYVIGPKFKRKFLAMQLLDTNSPPFIRLDHPPHPSSVVQLNSSIVILPLDLLPCVLQCILDRELELNAHFTVHLFCLLSTKLFNSTHIDLFSRNFSLLEQLFQGVTISDYYTTFMTGLAHCSAVLRKDLEIAINFHFVGQQSNYSSTCSNYSKFRVVNLGLVFANLNG